MNSGTAETGFEDPAAAREGMELNDGVGLFMTGGAFWSGTRAKLASVAMLDADMLRAGLAGLPPTDPGTLVKGDGDAAATGGGAGVALEIGGLLLDAGRGMGGTEPCVGAAEPVGVGCGVDAAEFAFATDIGAGLGLEAVGTVY